MMTDLPPSHPAAVYVARVRTAIAAVAPPIGDALPGRLAVRIGEADSLIGNRIILTPRTAALAARSNRSPSPLTTTRAALALLIPLHLSAVRGSGPLGTLDRALDTALARAVGADTLGAVHARLHGAPASAPRPSGRCVQAVVRASGLLSGRRPPWSAPAVRLRASLLLMSPPLRRDALTVAGYPPARWCR